MNIEFRLDLGELNGRVEVDNYGSGRIYLETVDTSGPGEDRYAVVILKPKQARKVAKALLRATE